MTKLTNQWKKEIQNVGGPEFIAMWETYVVRANYTRYMDSTGAIVGVYRHSDATLFKLGDLMYYSFDVVPAVIKYFTLRNGYLYVNKHYEALPDSRVSHWVMFQSVVKEVPANDPVNKPAHYTDGKIEVIDFIEDKKLCFHLGNTVKYIASAGKKDPAKVIEDLEKAQWYLNRKIENLKHAKQNNP